MIADRRAALGLHQDLGQPPACGCLDFHHGLFGFDLNQRLARNQLIADIFEPADHLDLVHHEPDLRNVLRNQGH